MAESPVSTVEINSSERLDKVLASHLQYSRSKIQAWIREGRVTIDDRLVDDKSYRVSPGSVARIELPEREFDPDRVHPEPGEVPVVYEDPTMLAINKPRDLVVHPGPGHRSGTLANRLLYHYPDLSDVGESHRAGMVHRLDRETTGIMLIARTQEAYDELKRQFAARTVKKKYRTILEGNLEEQRVRVKVPIGRDPDNPILRQADPAGKASETLFEVEAVDSFQSLAWGHPKTGRTHQIRVHARYLGHPVLGDEKYGTMTSGNLMLHAEQISVKHPETGDDITLSAKPPEEVMEQWNQTGNVS